MSLNKNAKILLDDYDYLFKIVFIGNAGVGKSSIITRFTEGIFYGDSYISTIGVDFRIKSIEYKNKKIKLQIWDTAGQERFRTITTSYYRGANCIVLVCDVSNRQSFGSISQWLNEINKYNDKRPHIILIGNKSDIEDRDISRLDAEEIASKYQISYIETSAKKNLNIDAVFSALINKLINEKNIDKQNKKYYFIENNINDTANLNLDFKHQKKCC